MPYHSFLRILLSTIRTDYTIALLTAIVLSIFTAGALNDGDRYTRESVLNSGSWVRVKVYDNGKYHLVPKDKAEDNSSAPYTNDSNSAWNYIVLMAAAIFGLFKTLKIKQKEEK